MAVRHWIYPLSVTSRRQNIFDDGLGNTYPQTPEGFLDCYSRSWSAEWPVTRGIEELKRDDTVWVHFRTPVNAIMAVGYLHGAAFWSDDLGRDAIQIDWDPKLTHRLQDHPITATAHGMNPTAAVRELDTRAMGTVNKWMRGQFPPVRNRALPKTGFASPSVEARQGQAEFRQALMVAYRNLCVVTGCAIRDLLHAAHIVPPSGASGHNLGNGLLLRADIHDLFDRGLITIDRQFKVWVHPSLREREYRTYHGERASLVAKYANPAALRRHRDLHGIDTSL